MVSICGSIYLSAIKNGDILQAKSVSCLNCGANLEMPKKSKSLIKCQFCLTESILENFVKNVEIAAKKNINSGIPLSASPAKLHRILVSVLSSAPNMPIDIFEQVEIIREERYCAPAYLFYCNGTMPFTYEFGVEKKRAHIRSGKHGAYTVTKTETEWNPGNSSVSASEVILVPGNKEMFSRVKELYKKFDHKKLIDIEELEYPYDVETYDYNLPELVAFNEHATPHVNEVLQRKVETSMSNQNIRNLSKGGSSIQKDVVRIFLGFYCVVFTYGGKEYEIWISGDGETVSHKKMPEDLSLKKDVKNRATAMEQEIALVSRPKTFFLTFCLTIGLGVILAGAFLAVIDGYSLGWSLIAIGFIVVCLFRAIKVERLRPYNEECAEIRSKHQEEIDVLESREANAVRQFKTQQKNLRGIYQNEDLNNVRVGDKADFQNEIVGGGLALGDKHLSPDVSDKIMDLVHNGERIKAAVLLRQNTGLNSVESIEYINRLSQQK